jgi:twitching motility two-component system response regulator PilG
VLEIDSAHPQARAALARLLVTQAGAAAAAGRPNDASAWAREATELTPESDAAWLALASASTDRSDRIVALRRAFELNPQPATRGRLRQALVWHAMLVGSTDRSEARTLFRQATALDPGDTRVWQALVQLADTPGDALEVVRDFVRVVPGHPAGRVWLAKALAADARALDAAGLGDEACIRWHEILDLDPRNVDAWLGLAQSTADEDEAKRAVETAFDIDPDDERVSAAMLDWQDTPLDPAAFAPPEDAFEHLATAGDTLAALDTTPDPFAQIDLAADPFARFAPDDSHRRADRHRGVGKPAPSTAIAPATIEPAVEPPLEIGGSEPAVQTEETTIDLSIAAAASGITADTPEPDAAQPAAAGVSAEPVVAMAAGAAIEPVAKPVPAPPHKAAVVVPIERPAAPAVPSASDETGPGQPEPIAPEPPAAVRVPGATNGRRTVMVVDDSPTIRKILGLTLERAGYKVVAEPDGESAVERLTQVVPDVILLDIAMPKLDGYEVCKRIRKDPRTAHVPVVMLSGKDALFDKVKGHMAGATEYLTKPFETPAVLAAVSAACNPGAEAVNG